MKPILFSILLVLTGCQATPNVPPPPLPPRPPVDLRPAPVALVAPSPSEPLERKVREQAQYIEALLSQNEALKSGLPAKPAPAVSPGMAQVGQVSAVPPPVVAPVTPSPVATEEPALAPNADGVIDLTATTLNAGEPVNPFAVRTAPDGASREVTLHVSGLIAGPSACAVINERLVQAGDVVEPFRVERVDSESVSVRLGERRLRLPLSEKPVRVRLPN
jgi:hypothetical protein